MVEKDLFLILGLTIFILGNDMRRLVFTSLFVLIGSFTVAGCQAGDISQEQVKKVLDKPVQSYTDVKYLLKDKI